MAAVMIPLHDRLGATEEVSAAGDRFAGDRFRPFGEHWLYRRRRLVVLALAAVTALGVVRTAGDVVVSVGGDLPPPPAAPRTHLVQPGDSYWSIARTFVPDGDVRPLVDRLIEVNGGAELRAGDTLVLRW